MKLQQTTIDPLDDGKSKIELIDFMGSDICVAEDARASFEKSYSNLSDEELTLLNSLIETHNFSKGGNIECTHIPNPTEKDIKLINYLIEHEHFSPLRGVVFKFKIKCPLFVCRQWWKHTIASSHTDEQIQWNEKSFRYVEIKDENDFYVPLSFYTQSKSNKQARAEAIADEAGYLNEIYAKQCQESYRAYTSLIEAEVAREQARGVLVPSFYTTFIWTVSLQALLHFLHLRSGKGAQTEIVLYAKAIEQLIETIVPVSLAAWKKYC